MKYLIIGNGGREHAILKTLGKNKHHQYFYTGDYNNPGMDNYATLINNTTHPIMITLFSKQYEIDIVIIGPESYLEQGLVDMLKEAGIKCIGPKKGLAMLETSKSFARELMTSEGLSIYCPKYKLFDKNSKKEEYINYMNELGRYVIKADGLHGGKGVKVYGDHIFNIEEGSKYCEEILSNNEKFVIEEKLIGDEFSLMSFTDGKTFKHMPVVQDYKRAYNGDQGPNTGSMGSVSYEDHLLSFLSTGDVSQCEILNERVIKKLQDKIGDTYCGILYGSYMKTENGMKIIEYNVRFGDPECINVLSILNTDLSEIFNAMVKQELDTLDVKFEKKATCCRYLVPKGYPDNPVKNHEIYIDDKMNLNNLICASMSVENGDYYYELGSRTAAVIGVGNNMMDAVHIVDHEIKYITGPLFSRTDIGKYISNKKHINKMEYKDAGVDIDEGNKVIKKIKSDVESTFNYNVISKFGDFAGLYQLNNNQILVTSTDGVGTKSLLVLQQYGPEKGYEMLGRDLVSHSVNDILVKGAKPLFFLDYYASSKIKAEYVQYFVKGLSEACKEVGCVLIGGETAEMPDVYQEGACDIVGTIVGIVEKDKIINGKEQIQEGDLVIGLSSSGPHTNGYSLIRKLVDENTPKDIMNELCATHRCYYHEIMNMLEDGYEIHGMCHITGGGWEDNSERVIPDGLKMDLEEVEMSRCFKYLQECGKISEEEMRRTFNCGIGMLVYVKNDGRKMDNVIGNVKRLS